MEILSYPKKVSDEDGYFHTVISVIEVVHYLIVRVLFCYTDILAFSYKYSVVFVWKG